LHQLTGNRESGGLDQKLGDDKIGEMTPISLTAKITKLNPSQGRYTGLVPTQRFSRVGSFVTPAVLSAKKDLLLSIPKHYARRFEKSQLAL